MIIFFLQYQKAFIIGIYDESATFFILDRHIVSCPEIIGSIQKCIFYTYIIEDICISIKSQLL